MKLKIIFLISIVLLLGVGFAKAQQIGGYSESSVKDAEVIKAAKLAVQFEQQKSKNKITLRTIKAAQKQVVAGMNYKICLLVKVKKVLKPAVVVVYRNLQGEYSLTSWDWQECK